MPLSGLDFYFLIKKIMKIAVFGSGENRVWKRRQFSAIAEADKHFQEIRRFFEIKNRVIS